MEASRIIVIRKFDCRNSSLLFLNVIILNGVISQEQTADGH